MARLMRFDYLTTVGRRDEAEVLWKLLDPMGRNWSRSSYLPGDAEWFYVWFRFNEGSLSEEQLAQAEEMARSGKNRPRVRQLHRLRGEWQMQHKQWSSAADTFSESIRMARVVGQISPASEALLALAKFKLGMLPNARQHAEQLTAMDPIDNQAMAELWFAIGDPVQAKRYALQAYEDGWADGEPYVLRYDLNKARNLLNKLGVDIPNLPPYDPAADEKFPWEDELVSAIEDLREEKSKERDQE